MQLFFMNFILFEGIENCDITCMYFYLGGVPNGREGNRFVGKVKVVQALLHHGGLLHLLHAHYSVFVENHGPLSIRMVGRDV